ncbi:MAG: radical SAM protein [Nanoarchaeota archaeon]
MDNKMNFRIKEKIGDGCFNPYALSIGRNGMLKLEEVLWEVTSKCNKNCHYCGSKNVLNKKELTDDDKIKIAKQLADYGVKEVVLSGGEPGCLDTNTLKDIIRVLRNGNCIVKVVTNGKIFEHQMDFSHFDAIGLSVNEIKDIEFCKDKRGVNTDNFTIITNFGTHNIWDFDKLYNFAMNYNCWQVQLTMGELMLNADGIKYLKNKIKDTNKCFQFNPSEGYTSNKIILADNLQDGYNCTVGIRSCGITYTGEVIACLSERSYSEKLNIYGKLPEDSIENIWENKFKDIRFKCNRKCCRDYIKYPDVDKIVGDKEYETLSYPISPNDPVYIYGVQTPSDVGDDEEPIGGVMIYGVAGPKNNKKVVMMYGVFRKNKE